MNFLEGARMRPSSRNSLWPPKRVRIVPFQEPLQHDVSRLGCERAQMGRQSHSLSRSVHSGERGGGRVRSPLRLRHYKMQISLQTADSPDSQPAGFLMSSAYIF